MSDQNREQSHSNNQNKLTKAIFSLNAQTSIHVGASSGEAAIDIPIQREAHTDWPVIVGSSVKGGLRSYFRQGESSREAVEALFGSEDNLHGGALMISDARLLLLPVRSLTGHFKWLCCPAIVQRLSRDLQRFGYEDKSVIKVPENISEQEVFVSDQNNNQAEWLYLEEFCYQVKTCEAMEDLANLLGSITGLEQAETSQQLAMVSNDQFRYFCRAAIPVNAHIRLKDDGTKSVEAGALWYEESLPPSSQFYLMINAVKPRKPKKDETQSPTDSKSLDSAESVFEYLTTQFKKDPYLQIGGNETTGMGWFQCNRIEFSDN